MEAKRDGRAGQGRAGSKRAFAKVDLSGVPPS